MVTDAVGEHDRGLQVSFLLALPTLFVAVWWLRRAASTFGVDRGVVLDADYAWPLAAAWGRPASAGQAGSAVPILPSRWVSTARAAPGPGR